MEKQGWKPIPLAVPSGHSEPVQGKPVWSTAAPPACPAAARPQALVPRHTAGKARPDSWRCWLSKAFPRLYRLFGPDAPGCPAGESTGTSADSIACWLWPRPFPPHRLAAGQCLLSRFLSPASVACAVTVPDDQSLAGTPYQRAPARRQQDARQPFRSHVSDRRRYFHPCAACPAAIFFPVADVNLVQGNRDCQLVAITAKRRECPQIQAAFLLPVIREKILLDSTSWCRVSSMGSRGCLTACSRARVRLL